jgi:hypothetical protein
VSAMGAWGAGVFENDDAGDWVWELEDDNDASVLHEALAAAVDTPLDEPVEAPDASNALAAAEIVAAARGRHGAQLPSEAREWIGRNAAVVDARTVALATAAVERISINSELKDLWEDAQSDEWSLVVSDLLERLRAR